MTFDDWLDGVPEDERRALTLADAWNACAEALLETLVERGYIARAMRIEPAMAPQMS